ncbi:unnamed protein product [Arctogadus glacialis]
MSYMMKECVCVCLCVCVCVCVCVWSCAWPESVQFPAHLKSNARVCGESPTRPRSLLPPYTTKRLLSQKEKMNTSGQKKVNFEFIRKKLMKLSNILHDPKFVLNHCVQNKLITMREYKEKTDDSSVDILSLLMQKGEDRCQKFISLVLKDPEVQETFPMLEDLDWASLDSPPPPVPERTSMPGQGPRPEWSDVPPGSSPMEID